jgi:hypothetical protein
LLKRPFGEVSGFWTTVIEMDGSKTHFVGKAFSYRCLMEWPPWGITPITTDCYCHYILAIVRKKPGA